MIDRYLYKIQRSLTWWISNSLVNICSASKALIVVKPCKVAFKCVNTGLRAIFIQK